jgi:hypothetical protein
LHAKSASQLGKWRSKAAIRALKEIEDEDDKRRGVEADLFAGRKVGSNLGNRSLVDFVDRF